APRPGPAPSRAARREGPSDRRAVLPSWTQASTPRALRQGLPDRCDAGDEPTRARVSPKEPRTDPREPHPKSTEPALGSGAGPSGPLPEPECRHPGRHGPAQGRGGSYPLITQSTTICTPAPTSTSPRMRRFPAVSAGPEDTAVSAGPEDTAVRRSTSSSPIDRAYER